MWPLRQASLHWACQEVCGSQLAQVATLQAALILLPVAALAVVVQQCQSLQVHPMSLVASSLCVVGRPKARVVNCEWKLVVVDHPVAHYPSLVAVVRLLVEK
jgi:hypothetical protein